MMHSRKSQQGVSLLEALISVLIFSVGILAIVALQTISIKTSNEAKYRADASYLATQLIGRMWTDRTNLANYAYNTAGAAFNCDAAVGTTVAAPANAALAAWLQTVAATLPNATSGAQRVDVGAGNVVTVRMCWRIGTDATKDTRQFVVSTQING